MSVCVVLTDSTNPPARWFVISSVGLEFDLGGGVIK